MDILLPFVDGDDPQWQEIFCNAKNLHPRTPRARSTMFLPFKRRFSSHGLFKYWWRALEQNYKSLTKVHLLLMQPSQFPAFLNKGDPRIVVHYHNEFIPEKFRPCFNSSTIELCAIRELPMTGNFILANDDMYVNSPIDDTYFEQDGKPLTFIASRDTYGVFNTFRSTLTNGHRLVKGHYGVPLPYYKWHHLFQVYDSDFCKDFLGREWETIAKGLSSWRNNSNYNHLLLMMAQNVSGAAKHSEKFPHVGYYEMPSFSSAMFREIDKCQVMCINDTDGVHCGHTLRYLESKYPNKCSFEI